VNEWYSPDGHNNFFVKLILLVLGKNGTLMFNFPKPQPQTLNL